MPNSITNLSTAGNTFGHMVRNSTQFIADTAQLVRSDPLTAGGRCMGVGIATAAGGFVSAAVGAVADGVGTTAMILGGLTMLLTDNTAVGGKVFAGGAVVMMAGKAAQVVGTVAMVAGSASAVTGTGLLVAGAVRNNKKTLPAMAQAVQYIPQRASAYADTPQPLKNRMRITVIDV